MKRLIFFFVFNGLTVIFIFGQRMETCPVSQFTGIFASGTFEITVVKGNEESLLLEADNDIMPYVHSKVKDGVLKLYFDKKIPEDMRYKTVKVNVVIKDLNKVFLSGRCMLISNDTFSPTKFKVMCSGHSVMMININTKQLDISVCGKNKIQINANVIDDTEVNMSGYSEVDLTGSTTNFKIDISGFSSVKAKDFIAKTANINSSGTCNVNVNVTDVVKINSSDTTTINYEEHHGLSIINQSTTKRQKK